jgi:superfamily II DNA or RNA helicase
MNPAPSITFDQGTLLLSGFSAEGVAKIFPKMNWVFDDRVGKYRTDACWYADVERALSQVAGKVTNDVVRWQKVAWSKNNLPILRPQQLQAVEAFLQADNRGVVVMPTGTGKTVVALAIAQRLAVSCLFVAPIRDLMYQWQRRIGEYLGYDVGIIGDNTFNVKPVSVTTYDSAAIHMTSLGNQFGLIVYDECHHLPGNFYRESAMMSAAPYRLGLTATPGRSDGRQADLENLIGKTIYELKVHEATGDILADYRVIRIPVTLSSTEQAGYDQLSQQIREYVYQRRKEDSQFDWQELCRESNLDPQARAILKAFRVKQAIENRAEEKLRVLEDLFRLHVGEPMIVFVGSNAMARDVSIRFLVPCLLSHCGKKERNAILSGFEAGSYPAIVANQILDEGVDLPDVKVAIVIGGSSSTRQAKQRLGRVLRKSPYGGAILYEVVLSETSENLRSRARRRSDAYRKPSTSNTSSIPVSSPVNIESSIPVSPRPGTPGRGVGGEGRT